MCARSKVKLTTSIPARLVSPIKPQVESGKENKEEKKERKVA